MEVLGVLVSGAELVPRKLSESIDVQEGGAHEKTLQKSISQTSPRSTDLDFGFRICTRLCIPSLDIRLLGAAVALTVGSVPRRIVPKLLQFNWLLKMNSGIDAI